jgi:hypothetical protein
MVSSFTGGAYEIDDTDAFIDFKEFQCRAKDDDSEEEEERGRRGGASFD